MEGTDAANDLRGLSRFPDGVEAGCIKSGAPDVVIGRESVVLHRRPWWDAGVHHGFFVFTGRADYTNHLSNSCFARASSAAGCGLSLRESTMSPRKPASISAASRRGGSS